MRWLDQMVEDTKNDYKLSDKVEDLAYETDDNNCDGCSDEPCEYSEG